MVQRVKRLALEETIVKSVHRSSHVPKRNTLLILSQVYVPDPASVGQHMHDAAAEMVARGWRSVVLTSARGYDDPSRKYPSREVRDGVQIRRLALSSFGKRSIAVRLIGAAIFMLQAILRGLLTRRLGGILVSTSPPMCSAAALLIGFVRRVPITYWAMDLNPDQMIVMGKTTEESLAARLFNMLNGAILARAARVVALDRFMAKRLECKQPVGRRMIITSPWPHLEAGDSPSAHDDNNFRREHDLCGRFVVMYSGNMSPSHPVDTILEAALRLGDDRDLVFLFIGGGLGRLAIQRVVEAHHPANIRLLPYQPLERLRDSLSAADVHLVSMGDNMVGIVHPCKVYGAMAVGRPILLLGPDTCHISDILAGHDIGWRIDHGDVDAAVNTLRTIRHTSAEQRDAQGQLARQLVMEQYGKVHLRGRFCDAVEAAMTLPDVS